MKPLFFIFIFLILFPIVSANSIERKIEITDIYFNNVSFSKEYQITLIPMPYIGFDYPGYSVTEYLPKGFEFVGTNADKYTLIDNKLQILKMLPQSNNFSLTYKVQYKKSFDPISLFYGTYLDENRNYGTVNSTSSTLISSNTIIRDSIPIVSYEKSTIKTTDNSEIQLSSEFIPLPSSPITVIPISDDNNIEYILAFTLIIIIFSVIIFVISIYHKIYRIYDITVFEDGNIVINKDTIGITKEIRFNFKTTKPLSVKIKGDLVKILTSIKEIPEEKRCFIVTLNPDGKKHSGTVIFSKKSTKNTKYKVKKQ